MAYREDHHRKFVGRLKSFMRLMRNLQREADYLDSVYVHETASGQNDYFVDTQGFTKQELQDAMDFVNSQQSVIENNIGKITPFLN